MVRPVYFAKRMIRRQIPAPAFFGLMRLLRRTAKSEDRPDATFAATQERLQSVPVELGGRHVLDLGSGRHARLALRFLKAGAARVTLADLHARPLDDPAHRAILEADCARLGLDPGAALAAIRPIAGDFLNTAPDGPDEMADLVVSDSTMEHVRDPAAVFRKCREWLRPGGVASHRIDLRDHLFATPFEMLTCSDRTWNRWLDPKGGFHLNRWRLPDYLEAMQEAGFGDIGHRTLQRDEAALMRIRPRLDARFRAMDTDLLSVQVVHLHGRKPSG